MKKKDRGEEVIYTFKTKAISGKNHEYNVNITESEYNGKPVLSIENTPGCWYVETLLDGNTKNSDILSIQGNDWLIYNWKDIRTELLSILPDLEIIKNTKNIIYDNNI